MSKFGMILTAAMVVTSVSAYAQQVVSCSSDDGSRVSCPADVRGGVQLSNQRSGSACQRGYSWGTDQAGIWVDHGCRADFVVNTYNAYQNQNGAAGSGGTVNCSSDDGGRHSCAADVRGGVQLANQRSGSACQQGYSWGTDANGIWVDHGCRADFTINPYNPYQNAGGNGTINCSSEDGGRHNCAADVRGGVQLTNQRSGSPCQQGYSWGTDQNGIWVDHGCRADFTVNPYNPYQNAGGNGTINCSSDDGERHHCNADVRRGVQLVNQRSGSPCQQGYSWGTDRKGIWVDHGCRADFAVGQGGGVRRY